MLVAGLVAGLLLMGLSLGLMAVTVRSHGERTQAIALRRALDNATSGVHHALVDLQAEGDGVIGSAEVPFSDDGTVYWVEVEAGPEAGTLVLRSTGRSGLATQTLEVVAGRPAGGIYDNAIFAGNASGDPLYRLELGGRGARADHIDGNVYSGGDVAVTWDAEVSGIARAAGEVHGADGEEGETQPIPDLEGMDYEDTADYDVAELFDGDAARYRRDGAGGYAWQLPEWSPAHIFRKNPSDRRAETRSTEKDDYFLEDPYEPVRADYAQDGRDPYRISLSGVAGEPGEDGNRKVYYVDGNLWLHNKRTYSLGFDTGGPSGVQVTFVVRGNIYISDNVFYHDERTDGVAFIAMEDPDVEDSGNVYFGDPAFGTLREMQGFLYAEKDFYDTNLDAAGSTRVSLLGNMTAGNHVLIERDHWTGDPDLHTRLDVAFDDRIASGELVMPGLPSSSGMADDPGLAVLAWRRIGAE